MAGTVKQRSKLPRKRERLALVQPESLKQAWIALHEDELMAVTWRPTWPIPRFRR